MHLDREQLERALDPELRTQADIKDHLASCAECRARVGEAEREETWIQDRLRALDHVTPRVSAQSLMHRSGAYRRSWQRLAAGIFLALAAAGVAYATPGSPLPGMMRRVVALLVPAPAPPRAPGFPSESPTSSVGIAVDPGERLTVEFATPQAGDTALVSLTDGAEVVVRGVGGTTTFVSAAERLVVRHVGIPGRFEVQVPRGAPSVILTSGKRRLWAKVGSRIEESVPPNPSGLYLLPLSQDSASPASSE